MNSILKTHLTWLNTQTHLTWDKLLPLTLLQVRVAPHKPHMLSPFELMYGCPLTLGNIPLSHKPHEDYFSILTHTRNTLRDYANDSLPSPLREILSSPPIVLGDYVYIKTLTLTPLSPMWTGPYLVLRTTPMVAKLQGIGTWIHFSCLKLISQVQPSRHIRSWSTNFFATCSHSRGWGDPLIQTIIYLYPHWRT